MAGKVFYDIFGESTLPSVLIDSNVSNPFPSCFPSYLFNLFVDLCNYYSCLYID